MLIKCDRLCSTTKEQEEEQKRGSDHLFDDKSSYHDISAISPSPSSGTVICTGGNDTLMDLLDFFEEPLVMDECLDVPPPRSLPPLVSVLSKEIPRVVSRARNVSAVSRCHINCIAQEDVVKEGIVRQELSN